MTVRRRGPGRPKAALPPATTTLTRRVRRLVDDAHEGNLREAASHSGLRYGTLRDLYTGRTLSPGLDTLRHLAGAYRIPLEWFLDEDLADEPQVSVWGVLPPDPEFSRGREGRRIRIPLTAWPLARAFLRLEQALVNRPASPSRPVIGGATDPGAIRQAVTRFLLAPLLEAHRIGQLPMYGVEPPFRGSRRPDEAEWETWVGTLKALGRFWERALGGVLDPEP